jgi:hypothetical protein
MGRPFAVFFPRRFHALEKKFAENGTILTVQPSSLRFSERGLE